MINNVEKLTQLDIIGVVRYRFGANNKDDNSVDVRTNKMSNSALDEAWDAWELGNGYWPSSIMKVYDDKLEKLNK